MSHPATMPCCGADIRHAGRWRFCPFCGAALLASSPCPDSANKGICRVCHAPAPGRTTYCFAHAPRTSPRSHHWFPCRACRYADLTCVTVVPPLTLSSSWTACTLLHHPHFLPTHPSGPGWYRRCNDYVPEEPQG